MAALPPVIRGERIDPDWSDVAGIEAYNRWAGEHESILAKSLFCAGTTWPGVFLAEDRAALDVLCARADVDVTRIGCGGLSGGGLRTVMLAGADQRIACAVCVGMMTTWRDYLLNKSHTHTWMIYVPHLPHELDYPEILGLRVPNPTLVLNDIDDPLFTLPEMQRAAAMLGAIFAKAGAADRYRCSYYPGGHKFDLPMQAEAFDWFDRWLT
jgi:dienelactone hydrolase